MREFYAEVLDGLSGPVVAYDSAAVGEFLTTLALTTLGVPARPYIGAFIEWSSDPSRRIAKRPRGADEHA